MNQKPEIRFPRKTNNNLRYSDSTTLVADSEKLRSLLMKEKEESIKAGLRLDIKKKTKIMASGPITYCQIKGEKTEAVSDFILLDSKITADGDCSH